MPELSTPAANGDGLEGGAVTGVMGPAWTRGLIEQPQGEKDMGGWKAAVYTEEQQARLNVSEDGTPVSAAEAVVSSDAEGANAVELA